MDDGQPEQRIQVSVGANTMGVLLILGDVQVAVTLPAPVGMSDLTVDQVRATALRYARRALEVAREELE